MCEGRTDDRPAMRAVWVLMSPSRPRPDRSRSRASPRPVPLPSSPSKELHPNLVSDNPTNRLERHHQTNPKIATLHAVPPFPRSEFSSRTPRPSRTRVALHRSPSTSRRLSRRRPAPGPSSRDVLRSTPACAATARPEHPAEGHGRRPRRPPSSSSRRARSHVLRREQRRAAPADDPARGRAAARPVAARATRRRALHELPQVVRLVGHHAPSVRDLSTRIDLG